MTIGGLGRSVRNLTAAALVLTVSACSKRGTDYGTLSCLDGWPPLPPSTGLTPSLSVAPSVVWQASFGLAPMPQGPGVALSNGRVIASAGAYWYALDRATGAIISSGRGDAPPNYFLGAPAVDRQGGIYVQSNIALDALDADGNKRWSVGIPGEGQTAEPLLGCCTPSILGDALVIAGSRSGYLAFSASSGDASAQTVRAHIYVGHWGVGYDQAAAFVDDLRTGKPAGRLRAANGHEVYPIRPLAGRGLVAWDRDNTTALRLVLLDTCGNETWSLSIPGMKVGTGGGVTGPDDVLYLNVGSNSGGEPPPSIIGVSPDGKLASGPVPSQQLVWLAGADGTVYTVDNRSTGPTSQLSALSPSLEKLWTIDVQGSLSSIAGASAIMDDSGIIYLQVSQTTGNAVVAIQTTSPGPAKSSWPMLRHDSRASNWLGDVF